MIQYAARALQLGQELFGDGVEAEFLQRLEAAESNLPEHRNGRVIYEKWVRPGMIDLAKVGAHYAVASLFEDFPHASRIHSYDVCREAFEVAQTGRARLALGRATITSRVTRESKVLSFGVLHLGDQNVSGGVREYQGEDAYGVLVAEAREIFDRGDIPGLVRAVDRNFGDGTYSLRFLFKDEQRRIVGLIMDQALAEAASLYKNFYAQYATLARFVTELGIPMPARFQMAVDFTLNENLMDALASDDVDRTRIQALLAEVKRTGILLDRVTLEFTYRRTLERAAEAFRKAPLDEEAIGRFERLAAVCPILPFPVNLWAAQNEYHAGWRTACTGHAAVPSIAAQVEAIGAHLGFRREAKSDVATAN